MNLTVFAEYSHFNGFHTVIIQIHSIWVNSVLWVFLLESKLGSFWTTFLDAKKQLFVSEKLLTSATDEGTSYHSILIFFLFKALQFQLILILLLYYFFLEMVTLDPCCCQSLGYVNKRTVYQTWFKKLFNYIFNSVTDHGFHHWEAYHQPRTKT